MYTGAVQAGRCVGPENRTAPENTNRKRTTMKSSTEIAIRARMHSDMTDLTDRLITKTVANVSFEQIYSSVYQAILHRMGNDWLEVMHTSANRLVFEFRNDRRYYDLCVTMMRDVSLFAEMRFLNPTGPEYGIKQIFDKVWEDWHADKELRAWVLWRPVRTMRAKIAAVALFTDLYTEVSFRPGNTGYERCKKQFVECVEVQAL